MPRCRLMVCWKKGLFDRPIAEQYSKARSVARACVVRICGKMKQLMLDPVACALTCGMKSKNEQLSQ